MRLLLAWIICCMFVNAGAHMNPISIENLSQLTEDKLQFINKYKFIVLGEIHGINETPQLALGLIKLLKKPVVLAIEIWSSEQCAIEQFMMTGDVERLKNSSFFTNHPQYGVGSLAMIELLQEVRKIPNVTVVGFDPFSAENNNDNQKDRMKLSQERDFKMAKILIQKFKENEKATIIVLTGSLHASKEINSILGVDYKPMGYWLSHIENTPIPSSEVLSIQLKFEQGKSWGGFSEDGLHISYGVHEMPKEIDEYSQLGFDKYVLMKDAENAIFFSRHITPSFPVHK